MLAMEDLTLIFWLLAIGFYALTYFRLNVNSVKAISYLSFMMSMLSMALILRDTTIEQDVLLIVLAPMFFVLVMSMWRAFDISGGKL